jgi:hypothetical protein
VLNDETVTFLVFEFKDITVRVCGTAGAGGGREGVVLPRVGKAPTARRASSAARSRSSASLVSVSAICSSIRAMRASRWVAVSRLAAQCGQSYCGRLTSQRMSPQLRHRAL